MVNPKELIFTPKLPVPHPRPCRGFLFFTLSPLHQKIPVVLERQVSIIIAKEIHHPFFVGIGVGDVLKIESLLN
jgi:hypothetical protein